MSLAAGRAPAVLLLLGLAAGAAAGTIHLWWPALFLCVAALVGGARGARTGWILGVTALGVVHGAVARSREGDHCVARLQPGNVRLLVRTVDPSGGTGRVDPIGAGCDGTIQVRWPATRTASIPAGAVVRIVGAWRAFPGGPRPSGMLLARGVERVPAGGSMRIGERVRTASERVIAGLYGARAPVVEAVLLGRRDGLDPQLRDAFADAGLVHLLAISGFHVGLIAGWLLLCLRAVGVRRSPAGALAALGAIGYAAFLGWPAPATRAALLAAIVAGSRLRERRVALESVLALTLALLVFLDPWVLESVGAWLSAAAVFGVLRAVRWVRRHAPGRCQEALAASLGASLVTAPLTAYAFGTVALIGIPLNLIAIPLAGVAVPGALASLVLGLAGATSLAETLAAGTGLCLHALEAVARFGSAVPVGVAITEPGWRAAAPWVLVLLAAAWITGQAAPGRGTAPRVALTRLAACLAGVAWISLLSGAGRAPRDVDGRLSLHFLDVGQGDAAVVRTPHGRWVVIDAGPAGGRRDAGRQVVVPFLRRGGARRLDVLVLSHAHLDHIGGARAVLGRFPVDAVIEPAVPVRDSVYLALLASVDSTGSRYLPARPALAWTLDGVRFRVLHPDTTEATWGLDLNEDSAVLLIEYGAFRALFVGDAGIPSETALAGTIGPVAVLKVGHHGSRGASSAAFLAEVAPRVAVISVGVNRYGHPSGEALSRLAEEGAGVWRTDRDGTIRVTTDGRSYVVRAGAREQDGTLEPPGA